MNKKLLLFVPVALIALTALALFIFTRDPYTSGLKVHFFDAGKADSALISYNDDSVSYNVLIDTGEQNLSATLLSYLNSHNIKKLDYLIITHFDKDHVGSAADVLNSVEVSHVLQTNTKKDSDAYKNYLSALSKQGITPTTVSDDSASLEFSLGPLRFAIDGPEKIYSKKESNNSSLIVALNFGEKNFLFLGDAETDRLSDFLLTDLGNRSYNFIKFPYHGHFQDGLSELLEKTTPDFSVITSSSKEPEDEATLDLLKSKNIKFYLTRRGAVDVISCDGTVLEIRQ